MEHGHGSAAETNKKIKHHGRKFYDRLVSSIHYFAILAAACGYKCRDPQDTHTLGKTHTQKRHHYHRYSSIFIFIGRRRRAKQRQSHTHAIPVDAAPQFTQFVFVFFQARAFKDKWCFVRNNDLCESRHPRHSLLPHCHHQSGSGKLVNPREFIGTRTPGAARWPWSSGGILGRYPICLGVGKCEKSL